MAQEGNYDFKALLSRRFGSQGERSTRLTMSLKRSLAFWAQITLTIPPAFAMHHPRRRSSKRLATPLPLAVTEICSEPTLPCSSEAMSPTTNPS